MSEEGTTDRRDNETKVDSFTEKDVRGDVSTADVAVRFCFRSPVCSSKAYTTVVSLLSRYMAKNRLPC